MIPLVLAGLCGAGTHLIWTATSPSNGVGIGDRPSAIARLRAWSAQLLSSAGVSPHDRRKFLWLSTACVVLGLALGLALFAAAAPAAAIAVAAGAIPLTTFHSEQQRRRAEAREAWPHVIEEIRVLATSVGRSVPQALFEAGTHAPDALGTAFTAANREWMLTTDFGRTIRVLKDQLDDPTADAVCETLLIANQVGGSDLDARLLALAEDRSMDITNRKDALAKQAGVRFARRFVLVVPLGMAGVGLTIGDGRAAYADAQGQGMVLLSLALIAGCWIWAGRLLKLPAEPRVFAS